MTSKKNLAFRAARIIQKIWRGYYIRRITNCEFFYDSEFPFGSYDEYWSGSEPD